MTNFVGIMGRKKNNQLIENLTIASLEMQGKGVGRYEGKVIFVEGLLPGERADVKIVYDKRHYAVGQIVRMLEPSVERQQPFCVHFGLCGGCRWQHLPYNRQLHYKENFVREAISRLAKLSEVHILPIIGCDQTVYFRNKLDFAFSDQRWLTTEETQRGEIFPHRNALGFHISGRFDKVVHIEHCFLQPDPSNDIRNFIYQYAVAHQLTFFNIRKKKGLLRHLIVRTAQTGEVMVIVSFLEYAEKDIIGLMDALKGQFPTITSLNYVINSGDNDLIHPYEVVCYHGKAYITEQLGHLLLKIGPKSFFQTNTNQAVKLYDVVLHFAELTGEETVYDLYSGIGSIALYVAPHCRSVVGIEQVNDAVTDAQENARLNGITNCQFFSGDVRHVLQNSSFGLQETFPDVVIIDPPRAGMHPDVIQMLLHTRVPRIVYVSCNPITQARDLQLLSAEYEVIKVQPIDMFPQTYHIESVAQLVLRNH